MKAKALLFPLLLISAALAGCKSYEYHVARPSGVAQPITKQPVVVTYEPLEYRLARQNGRLNVRITNPTDDRVVMLGNRSYVIDPHGESHSVRSMVIGPHSYVSMLLPPAPIIFTSYGWGGGWGWAWGWGPYPPGDPFYFDYYPPPVLNTWVTTPYDWMWDTGPAKIRLTYESNRKTFDHDFEIIREQEKQ